MKHYNFSIIISIILTHAVFLTCKAQQESTDAGSVNDTSTINYSSKIRDFDFYKLWGTDTVYFEDESKSLRQELIGFTGDDYQRLYIHFLSVKKITSKINEYKVTGKTKVRSDIYSFKGTLTVNFIRIYKNNPNTDLANVKEGYINSSLTLYEDSTQLSSGKITGKLLTYITLDNMDNILYDYTKGNNACNDQFKGKRTNYKTKQSVKCYWGTGRIPDTFGTLDTGTASFLPSKKYYKNGWENYTRAVKLASENNKASKLSKEDADLLKNENSWWK